MFKKYRLEFDLDDPRATIAHRDIILNKPFLKRIYTDWYKRFISVSKEVNNGSYLEIGSGGGFLKDVFPEVITSDILQLPNVDMVFSAERMPFKKSELGCIMMLNVFHHIPKPYLFLKEAERTLVKGGKVIMIEPANTPLSRFIYKHFHHEPFDENGAREINPGNPLSNSNQALPYIYFVRDLELFSKDFPTLKIKKVNYISPLMYVISGGVSRSAMLPYFMYNLIKAIEFILKPFAKQISLFYEIELEKTD